MQHVHISPLFIAPKAGKLSRVCLNLSFTSRQHDELFPSYNDGVDTERAYASYYPHDPLPTLVTICTMMNRQRRYWSKKYPTLASLDGITVDMASAFQQYAATPEEACMAATIQNIRDVECVVFLTTGVFGDRLAGDAYNLIGRAVDHRHNQLLPHISDEYGPTLLPTNDETSHYSICPLPLLIPILVTRTIMRTPTRLNRRRRSHHILHRWKSISLWLLPIMINFDPGGLLSCTIVMAAVFRHSH
jgi:hypothetical protein